MNFWDDLYDKFKDRRYGALFLTTFLAVFGVLALCILFDALLRGLAADVDLERYFLDALPGIGLFGLIWIVLRWRRAAIQSRERSKYVPLSRDEVRVARSKLQSERRFQRPAPRAPDTNLKY